MNKHIVLLPGDGIGPEVTAEAVKALRAVEKKFGCSFSTEEALIGGAANDATGEPLPKATLEAAALADEKVQAFLAGAAPKKVIVVPGRLVNIVA